MSSTPTIHNRVRLERLKRGMSQQKLADKSGIAASTLARLDANAGARLSLQQALRIAEALGVSAAELIP